MDWSDFAGKKIGLLGAGKENISLIPHLVKVAAEITICDQNTIRYKYTNSIAVRSGGGYLENLDDFDIIFRSPGLPVEIVKEFTENLDKKPEVTSAMNLFLSMKGDQTIGVTGTKGKGTVSAMIADIFKAAGQKVILAGNIGNSIFDSWEKITDKTIIVMELSSFQLEDVKSSPATAVLLSISPDHLQPLSSISPNFHKDLPTYIKAKERLTTYQKPSDLIVFSLDSQPSKYIGLSSVARKVAVSARENADVQINDGIIEYGALRINLRKETKLKGYHTYFNGAVAVAVTKNLGVQDNFIVEGLANFKTLPHRMEIIGIYKGIEFVDDSYATSPEATMAALSAYEDKDKVVILGGSSKGADFNQLAKAMSGQRIKAAILIGEEAGKIRQSLKEFAPDLPVKTGFATFRDAVETAIHLVVSGDVVLLSPACASKDMFNNAAERGQKFIRIIHELI